MIVSTNRVVGDIEGVVARRGVGIAAALNYKRVLLAPDHVDLRDQQSVDEPRYTPTDVTWGGKGNVLILALF